MIQDKTFTGLNSKAQGSGTQEYYFSENCSPDLADTAIIDTSATASTHVTITPNSGITMLPLAVPGLLVSKMSLLIKEFTLTCMT